MNRQTLEIVANWCDLEKRNLNKYVFVDRGALVNIAFQHTQDNFEIPNWRFDGIYPKHEWAFAATQLLANCFNYAFNIFERPDEKYTVANPADAARPFTGAFAMDRKIYERFGESVPQLGGLAMAFDGSLEKTKRFFRGINDIPFPELRYACAIDFAKDLQKHYSDNPLNLLEDAMVWDEVSKRSVLRAFNNGKGLVELLVSKFPIAYGADVRDLNGQKLAFNKRAMLVAVLLHGRALDSQGILPVVEDIDEVGPIADYQLPRALRGLGILEYSDELASLVDNWKEVPENSRMEVEIRAATVAACDMLMKSINAHRMGYTLSPINICHLDFWLWKTGKETKTSRPHLTRTSAY